MEFYVRAKSIVAIRHAKPLSQCFEDAPLDAKHLRQVRQFRAHLLRLAQKGEIPQRFDIAYTSSLKRARQTAQILFPKTQFIIDAQINERKTADTIYRSYRAQLSIKDSAQMYSFDYNGSAESLQQLERRIKLWLLQNNGSWHNKNILIVAHKEVLRILQKVLENRDLDWLQRSYKSRIPYLYLYMFKNR